MTRVIETHTTDVLLRARNGLLGSLERIGQTVVQDTFHEVTEKGGSPAEFGHIVLNLLTLIEDELIVRGALEHRSIDEVLETA